MFLQLKKYLSIFIAATSLLLLSVTTAPAADGEKGAGDKVASVNGVIITQKAFEREVVKIRQQFVRQGRALSDAQLSEVKKGILENLIRRELLYQESKKNNTQVADKEVTEQMKQIRKRFPSESDYQKFLQKMNVSEKEIKAKIKQDMTIQQFIEKNIVIKIKVLDKDVRSYYDSHPDYFKQPQQVRASHILIKVDPKATQQQRDDARNEIKKVQQKLKNGEDFATLARQFSQGPSSARDGDLGYFARGRMVKPFEDAALALNPGDVSNIVETQFGYHLIKVVEKKPASVIAYQQAREKIEQFLKQEKVRKEVALILEDLKKDAKIVRF